MAYMGIGLAKNQTLERLHLVENNFGDKESIQYIVKGLLDNQEGSKLVEIDLSNNRLNSETIEPLNDFFMNNFKLRTLNLRHNVITDEGAQQLC